jgi:hypothetical protein
VVAILTQAADPEDDGATRTYTRPDGLEPLSEPVELEAGEVPASGSALPTHHQRLPVSTMAFTRPAASSPDAELHAPNPPIALGMEQRATDELPAVEDASTGLYTSPSQEVDAPEQEEAKVEQEEPPVADPAPSKRTAMFTMPHIIAPSEDEEDEDDEEEGDDEDGDEGPIGMEGRTMVFAIPGNSHAEEDIASDVADEPPAEAPVEPPAADESPSRMTAQLTSLKQLQREEESAPPAAIHRRRGASTSSDELPVAAPAPADEHATGARTLMFRVPTAAPSTEEDAGSEEEQFERTAMMVSPSQAFTTEEEPGEARVQVPGIKPLKPKAAEDKGEEE